MSAAPRRPLMLAFLLGCVTMAAQALLLREHLLVYSGNELGIGGFLAAWMFWIGVGGLLGRSRAGANGPLARILLLLLPVAAAIELLMFWHLRRSAGVAVGGAFPLIDLLYWTALAALPVSLLAGFLFTWLARVNAPGASGEARAVLLIYGIEALGSAVGGVAVTVACWMELPVPWLVIAVGLLWWGGLTVALRGRRGWPAWTSAGLAAVLAVAAAIGLPAALERGRRESLPVPAGVLVQATIDTPYQNLAVARLGSTSVILSNAEVSGLFPDESAPLDAAILHTLAPDSPRTLVVGLGAPALVCELLARSDGLVSYVGADAHGLEFIAGEVPALQACLANPRLEVVAEEPLRYLDGATRESFQLIVYAVPEPRTAQSARFYSTEFMARVARVLARDGVFSFAISATENVLAGSTLQYVARLHQTLKHSFPQVRFTAGEEMRFFAGKEGADLSTGGTVLAERFQRLETLYPDVQPARLATRFEESRIADVAAILSGHPAVPLITANSPGVYLHKVLATQDGLAWLEPLSLPDSRFFLTLLVGLGTLLMATLLAGGRRGPAGQVVPVSLLLTAGMTGMAGQVLVLLGYQSHFGTLFADFGLLNAFFLAGLGVGGLLSWHRAAWSRKVSHVAAPVTCAGIVCLLEAGSTGWSTRVLLGGAPLVLGLSVGAMLSLALRRLQELGDSLQQMASSLEFLDHSGAVVGALLAGTLLIPVSGLVDTGWLLVAVGAFPAALAMAEGVGWRGGTRGTVPAAGWRVLLLWGVLLTLLLPLLPASPAGPDPIASTMLGPAVTRSAADPRSSWPECEHIAGWGGPLEMLVELGEDGRVVAASMGRQSETPEYLYGVGQWSRGLQGLVATDLCYDCSGTASTVDAFTGATVTGKAVVAAVRCFADPNGADSAVDEAGGGSLAGALWRVDVVLAALLVLVGGLLYWTGVWWLRSVLLSLLVALAGVWFNLQLTLEGLIGLAAGAHHAAHNHLLLVLAGGALLWGVLGGAIHCGYICPAGAAMSLLSRIGLRWRLPRSWDLRLRQVKYLAAALIIWGLLLAPAIDWGASDLLRYLFRGRYDFMGAVVLVTVALGTLVWMRPWCRYLCPLGAVLSLAEPCAIAGGLGPSRRSTHCHYGIEVGRDWDCLRCNRCVKQPLPRPRLHRPWLSVWLASTVVLLVLGMGLVRVVSPPDGPGPRAALTVTPVSGDESVPPPAATPSVPAGPRLFRQDNEAYPIQRQPGTGQLEEWLRAGRISGQEAQYFVPVPESPRP